jgi:hypothetical protein
MTNITRLQAFDPLHGVGTEPSWKMHPRRNPALCGPLMILAISLLLTITAPAQAEGPSCSLSRAAANWTITDSGTVIGVGPSAALGKFKAWRATCARAAQSGGRYEPMRNGTQALAIG